MLVMPGMKDFPPMLDWSNQIIDSKDIYRNQFVEYPLVNPSIMFRRAVYEKFGGYKDGDFPEDYEFYLRLQSSGVKMEKVNSVVLEWQDSSARLSRTNEKYTQEAFFKIKAKYLAMWLERNNAQHPEVIIWGGGKLAKRRSAFLKDHGVSLKAFIDIKRSNSSSTIYYKDISSFKNSFILSFVSNRGARDEVRDFLDQHGLRETIDYLICA